MDAALELFFLASCQHWMFIKSLSRNTWKLLSEFDGSWLQYYIYQKGMK
jgi:hypothetical protein